MTVDLDDLIKLRIQSAKSSKRLDLSNLRLESIPDEVFELDLVALYLFNNYLRHLPPEIGSLKNLKELYLSNNKIQNFPQEFFSLKNLLSLTFYGNEIIELGDGLGELTKLLHIYGSKNKLTNIPRTIKFLKQLQVLRLSKNLITEVPEELGELQNLQELLLEDNLIANLPNGVRKLSRLSNFSAQGNLLGIPKDVFTLPAQGAVEEILETQVSDQPFFEAKVIFAGDSGNGKTTMIDYLINDKLTRENLGTTHGIEQNIIEFTKDDLSIRANIWDLGGQEYMRSTHQFFFSQSALYVVVVQARHELKDLNYWMRLIKILAGDPPVVVVASKKDQDGHHLNERGIKRDYPNVVQFVYTSIFEPETITQELKNAIKNILFDKDKMPEVFYRRSRSWHLLKQEILNLQKYKDFLTFDDVKGITHKLDENLTESTIQRILELLNKTGNIVTLIKRGPLNRTLADMQILNPEWVTTGIYAILTDSDIANSFGYFEIGDVSRILTRKDYNRFPHHTHPYLIELLRHFELIYPVSVGHNRQGYLLPILFTEVEPDAPSYWNEERSIKMQFEYENFIPEQILPRFMVNNYQFVDNNLRWRSGVYLRLSYGAAKIYSSQRRNSITIEVIGRDQDRESYLRTLEQSLSNLNSSYEGLNIVKSIEFNDAWINYDEVELAIELKKEKILVTKLRKEVMVRDILMSYRYISEDYDSKMQGLSITNIHHGPVGVLSLSNTNVAGDASGREPLSFLANSTSKSQLEATNMSDNKVDMHFNAPVGNVVTGDNNNVTSNMSFDHHKLNIDELVEKLRDSEVMDKFLMILKSTKAISHDEIEDLETKIVASQNPKIAAEKKATLLDKIGRTIMPILASGAGNLVSDYLKQLFAPTI